MDTLKDMVSSAMMTALQEWPDITQEHFHEKELPKPEVELSELSRTQIILRVKPQGADAGAVRYFRVQMSEMM